jgi:hypothetical protein
LVLTGEHAEKEVDAEGQVAIVLIYSVLVDLYTEIFFVLPLQQIGCIVRSAAATTSYHDVVAMAGEIRNAAGRSAFTAISAVLVGLRTSQS